MLHGLLLVTLASGPATLPGPTHYAEPVYCGRECLQFVFGAFGVDATDGEIDALLGGKAVVSMAEMKEVVDYFSFGSNSIWLPPSRSRALGALLDGRPGDIAAVALIPNASPGADGHFVVVLEAGDKFLRILDVVEGKIHDIGFTGAIATGLRVILVTKDRSLVKHARLSVSISDCLVFAMSSWTLASGILLCLLALWSDLWSRAQTSVCSSIVARMVALQHWLARYRAKLALATVAASLLVLFTWFACREFAPVILECGSVNLRACPVGSANEVVFELRNRSLFRTIEIEKVHATCSCLTPRVIKSELRPGELGTVRVNALILQQGVGEQKIAIHASGASAPLIGTISYQGYESARLAPVHFSIGSMPSRSSHAVSAPLTVLNYDAEPVRVAVGSASYFPPGFVASIVDGANVLREGAKIILNIESDGSAPQGRFVSRLVLETLEPTPRTFAVAVHGMIVPAVSVEPRAFFLERAQPQSVSLVIQSRFETPLEVQAQSTTEGIAVSEIRQVSKDMVSIAIDVVPDSIGADDAVLQLHCESPTVDSFSIPFYLSGRE